MILRIKHILEYYTINKMKIANGERKFFDNVCRGLNGIEEPVGMEFEVRFSRQSKPFKSQITREEFDFIVKSLNDMSNFLERSEYDRMTTITENGFRIHTVENGEMIIEKKEQKKFAILNNVYPGIHLKFCVNSETILKTLPTNAGAKKCERNIHRIAFTPKNVADKFFKIELTVVNGKTFEVEIEFTNYKKALNNNALFKPISMVVNLLNSTPKDYNPKILKKSIQDKECNEVISKFNGLFNKTFTSSLFFPINKPLNVKKEHFKNIKKTHVYYPKLDGVRYLLYIDEKGQSWMCNTHKIIKFEMVGERLSNSIFDGEFYNEKFYIFDTLFVNGVDIRQEEWISRQVKTRDVNVDENENILRVRPFKNKSGFLDLEFGNDMLDGIIFTPIHEPYKNTMTYKFKPVDMMTIDMATKLCFDTDTNGYYLKLYIGGKDGLIQFNGNERYPFNSIININKNDVNWYKENDGHIVEYKWTNNTFIYERARPDKIVPNFHTVAEDVWMDINEPISLEDVFNNL